MQTPNILLCKKILQAQQETVLSKTQKSQDTQLQHMSSQKKILNVIIPKIKPSKPFQKKADEATEAPDQQFHNPFIRTNSYNSNQQEFSFQIDPQKQKTSDQNLITSQTLTQKNQFINFIQKIQRRTFSDTESDDLNSSASGTSGFVPFQDENRNTIQIAQNESQENEESKKNDLNEQNQNGHSQKKRKNRRSVDQVKETFRCFCGKNFVSYPGIYVHLKDKHLQQQQNQKFYLKTFKHKTTGEIVKQVVLENPKDSTLNVQLNESNSQKKNQPIVLQILDDDEVPIHPEPNTQKKRQPRRQSRIRAENNIEKKSQQTSQQKVKEANEQSMKQTKEDKYLKLACEYKELLEKFMKNQKEQNQTLQSLKYQLNQKDDTIQSLQKKLDQIRSSKHYQKVIIEEGAKNDKDEIEKKQQEPKQRQVINLQDDDEKDFSPQKNTKQTQSNSQESHSEIPMFNNEFEDNFERSQSSDKVTAKFGCSWESIQQENSLLSHEFQPLNEEFQREMIEGYCQEQHKNLLAPQNDYNSIELQEGEI